MFSLNRDLQGRTDLKTANPFDQHYRSTKVEIEMDNGFRTAEFGQTDGGLQWTIRLDRIGSQRDGDRSVRRQHQAVAGGRFTFGKEKLVVAHKTRNKRNRRIAYHTGGIYGRRMGKQLRWRPTGDDAAVGRVLLIADVTHAIPVRVARNNVRLIASGSGSLDELLIQHVAHSSDLKIGDILLSSGLGNIFPEGYPVATIISIIRDESRPVSQVRAKPIAQLDRLKYFNPITSTPRFCT